MEKSKFFAIYIRVSSEEQASSSEGSLASQLQRLKEYLSFKFGQSINYVIYREEGRSGKDTNRPEFLRLVSDIEACKIQAVLCTELSRVSRSVIDTHKFLELCSKYKVDFISLREQVDTTTAHGKLLVGIFTSLAQFEREQISERTSANMQARARRGLWNGGYVYGYLPRPGQKGYLDIEPDEAEIVNLIYDKYLEMGSYCNVTEWLNNNNYKTRRNSKWKSSTILRILKNPAYIGKRFIGKESINVVWNPIISQNKWQQVQDLLAQNIKTHSNSIKNQNLFSGLIMCQHCKVILENGSGTGNKGQTRYLYYRHPFKSQKETCPLKPYLPVNKVDKLLYDEVKDFLNDEELLNMICQEVLEKAKHEKNAIEKKIKTVENQISKIEFEKIAFVNKIPFFDNSQIKEFITPKLEELAKEQKQLQETRQALESEMFGFELDIYDPKKIKECAMDILANFEQMTQANKQKVIKELVGEIEIENEGSILMKIRAINKKLSEPFLEGSKSPVWLPAKRSKRTFANSLRFVGV